MAASQLWYVPNRPDLLLLAPCDEQGPLPCPGSMYVSVDHLHPPTRTDTKWRHPRATGFLTCYGDVATQQPRAVRCACGQTPCRLRGLQERGNVPDELIPADWRIKYDAPKPPAAGGSGGSEVSENRRATAVQLWLDCTAKAEKELPPAPGQEHPPEEKVLEAAEEMLTDYLKGRVCFHCSLPSTKMQKCGRCQQARYCSRNCQREDWKSHKQQCTASGTAGAAAAGTAASTATPATTSGSGDAAPATSTSTAAETAAAPEAAVAATGASAAAEAEAAPEAAAPAAPAAPAPAAPAPAEAPATGGAEEAEAKAEPEPAKPAEQGSPK